MKKKQGDWKVYPKIGGFEAECFFTNEGVKINDEYYPLYKENRRTPSDRPTKALIAPNSLCWWLDVSNPSSIEIQTKKKFIENPEEVLNNCYFFSLEKDNNLSFIPEYKEFSDIYDLLDSLNGIDRSLRITDWYVIGLIINKEDQSLLYIKPPLEAITRIKEITYNIGRTGAVMPVVKFEPVNFNGLLTLQAVLHNNKFLTDNKLQSNDIVTVKIRRQGNQTTEVSSVIYPFNKKGKIPTLSKCPSCNSTLVRKKGSEYLLCYNDYCQEKLIKKIIHWCSRDCLDIKGLGLKYVEHLVKFKIITTIDDIYTLTKDDLCKVPGILDKMADNILSEIEESKTKALVNIFVGLGIEHLGRTGSLLLAWHCLCIHELLNITAKNQGQLSAILGKEQRTALTDFLSREVNREIILNLSRHMNPKPLEVKINNHIYHRKTFILKGDFNNYSREEIKVLLMRAGIRVVEPDSKNFDFCLYCHDRRLVHNIKKQKTLKLTKLLQTILC